MTNPKDTINTVYTFANKENQYVPIQIEKTSRTRFYTKELDLLQKSIVLESCVIGVSDTIAMGTGDIDSNTETDYALYR